MEAMYSGGMAHNIDRTLSAAVPLMNQLTPQQSKYRGQLSITADKIAR
jgi:hypothetical protein